MYVYIYVHTHTRREKEQNCIVSLSEGTTGGGRSKKNIENEKY
jgi:hypothetical protein